ncbi:MAG TPA: phosphate/phosphonate ABC transporter permease [Nitrososphaera sp.]|nr:phosphate/phosphonate ABC transporter permease [Nitrososphaera sp.]
MNRLHSNGILITIALIVVGSSIHLNFNPISVFQDASNSGVIIAELLQVDFSVADRVLQSIVETLEMALIGSSIGFAISIPAALVASKNIAPFYLSVMFRGILNTFWSIPPLLWAIMLVAVAGLGPTAGIMAIALFTIGLSGKYLYEIYESQNPSAYDLIKVVGAGRLQMIKYVTIPESLPFMSNQYLFILSYNVRESAILGLVGAGGIGFYLTFYLESLQYSKVSLFIIAIVAVALAMDYLSTRLRTRLVHQ